MLVGKALPLTLATLKQWDNARSNTIKDLDLDNEKQERFSKMEQ